MIRVCSGFAPSARLTYGERFLRSFDRHWPSAVELQVWVEEPVPMARDACRVLWDIPGASAFRDRHRENAALHGREVRGGWKDREVQRGYSYRHDAYKFFKQILIPEAAAVGLEDGDLLVWLDGDVETTADVPPGLVPSLIRDAEVAFLGRARGHSEIGFWVVRINERTRRFLHEIAEEYRSDRFLELPEWHSAFIWDHVRARSGLVEHNICGPGAVGHVWPRTALARFMRHDKGERKPGA